MQKWRIQGSLNKVWSRRDAVPGRKSRLPPKCTDPLAACGFWGEGGDGEEGAEGRRVCNPGDAGWGQPWGRDQLGGPRASRVGRAGGADCLLLAPPVPSL